VVSRQMAISVLLVGLSVAAGVAAILRWQVAWEAPAPGARLSPSKEHNRVIDGPPRSGREKLEAEGWFKMAKDFLQSDQLKEAEYSIKESLRIDSTHSCASELLDDLQILKGETELPVEQRFLASCPGKACMRMKEAVESGQRALVAKDYRRAWTLLRWVVLAARFYPHDEQVRTLASEATILLRDASLRDEGDRSW